MFKTLRYNKRSIFYSFVITLGVILLMSTEVHNPSSFLALSIFIYGIILYELYYIWFVSKEKLKQLDLPLVTNYTRLKELIHHLILPTLMYVSVVGFIFFNNTSSIRIPIVVFNFIVFTALYINLKAFYLDKFELERNTYFVYDLIELLIFFLLTNVNLHVGVFFEINIVITIFFQFLLTLLLLFLNLYQFDEIKLQSILMIVGFSLLNAIQLYFISSLLGFNIIASSSVQFLLYYLLFGILRHKVDGTLTIKVILEYIAVLVLSIGLLIGVTQS